ncbi:HAD family hydrolase [Methanoplanus sp. FWC-SCC4]|uniref:HAD family hydrolase n=1 Tax=Methanochimaera problematica TaxID=2609417 RepID=A0AA97FCT9_9EURY|nr:HAD family hydrolase [Methanoplanus sp. FWC-SCC4]WOF15874.1 HAD family hydrolase [Methanoplanus sp. FWC-SCC4]
MKKIKPDQNLPCAILFDMDNTLYNFSDAKIKACEEVTNSINAGNADELMRYFLFGKFGFEDHGNIEQFMKDKNVWDGDKYFEAVEIYEDVKLSSITPYPGVLDILPIIKKSGIKMAIVTDAESSQAKKRLSKIGIKDYFQCIITPDISGKRKPEPDTFIKALEELSVPAKEAMVVGDSPYREIEPGNKLGMTTVYAKYGDWLKIPSPGIKPDYILEEFSNLKDILNI